MSELKLKIQGMHCTSCEKIIEKRLLELDGVQSAIVDFAAQTAVITFDNQKLTESQIKSAIEEKGYLCSDDVMQKDAYTINKKTMGFIFGIIGLLIIAFFAFRFFEGINIPEINQNMGYGLLFVVGLLTGFHCVSMCGGFIVSYTAKDAQNKKKSYKSHFSYATGKLISYTVIGAVFGLLGSLIVFTPLMRGVAGIIAGLFLVVFGLGMFGFKLFRKLRFKAPKSISKLTSHKSKSPLIIGLLNGLMIACGPLQAIYIMAAGTGSAIEGAKLLFVFALGTLPVMLGFGMVASLISTKATHKILKASGVIVIILGALMINRGLALTGTGLDTTSLFASVSASGDVTGNVVMDGDYQVIRMKVNRYGWEPDKFVLKKDVPVKWIITAKEINGCNNAIQVPKFGLKFDIKPGEQIITFTPDKEGVISWSCWMGMIPGTFVVKEYIGSAQDIQKTLEEIPEQPKSSCGGSGGCGCGG